MPPENLKLRPKQLSTVMKKYHERRLCLRNVGIDMTRPEVVRTFVQDFPATSVFMPENTHNKSLRIKLVFIEFQKPWEARVACKLINLMKHGNITAGFAENKEDVDNKPAPKLQERTAYPDGEVPDSGDCTYCGSPEALLVCDFCFTSSSCTFYCNRKHQVSHWPNHKYDCKPLPKLVNVADAAAAAQASVKPRVKLNVPHVNQFKADDSVVICHVANERVLIVRPIATNAEFHALLEKVRNFALNTPLLTEEPEIQDTVLAPLNGSYCRAQVIDTFEPDSNGNTLGVYFLEYGSTEKFPWTVLRKLSYKLRGEKRHTFKVVLKGVEISHSSEAENYLNKLKTKSEELLVVQEEFHEHVGFVVLKIKSTSEIVNSRIQQIVNIVEPFKEERILFDESKIDKLPTGLNVKVRIIDTTLLKDGFISCMDAENYMKFWEKDREINEYGNIKATDEAYEPILNEICMVKNDDRWERGSVVKLKDRIEMLLVDRFIMKNVSKEDIRRLPSKLASGFFTHLCEIGGINDQTFAVASEKIQARSNFVAQSVLYDEDKKSFLLLFTPN